MGMPNGLLAAALLAFLAGAVSGLATWKRPAAARVVAFAFAVLGSLLLAVASVGALAFPTGATWSLPLVTLFPCTVRLDPLSAWFTLALAILGLAVSWPSRLPSWAVCCWRWPPLAPWHSPPAPHGVCRWSRCSLAPSGSIHCRPGLRSPQMQSSSSD